MENNNEIGRSIQKRLEDLKATPSDDLWNEIELRMKKEKRKRVVPIWFWSLAGLALLLTGVLIGLQIEWEKDLPLPDSSEVVKAPANASENQKAFDTNTPIKATTDPVSKNAISKTSMGQQGAFSNASPPVANRASQKDNQIGMANRERSEKEINTSISRSKDQETASHITSPQQVTASLKTAQQKLETELEITAKESDTTEVTGIIVAKEEKQHKSTRESLKKDSLIQERRWSVSLLGSAHYYFNTQDSNFISSRTDFDVANRWSLNYGFTLNYQVSKRWQLRIGLNRLLLDQEYDINSDILLSDLDRVNAIVNTTEFSDFNNRHNQYAIRHSITYFQIPLEARYQLSENGYGWSLIGGMSYLQLHKSRVSAVAADESLLLSTNQDLRSLTLSFNLGLGYKYPILKRKLFFNGDLLFNYHLKPYRNFEDLQPMTIHPQIGLEYKF